MASWPAALPKFRASGAQFVTGKTGRRFETDGGPAEQRKMSTYAIEAAMLQLRCTLDQRITFDQFYAALSGGDFFDDFVHPRTGLTTRARFVVGKEPTYVPSAPYWDITVHLEIE